MYNLQKFNSNSCLFEAKYDRKDVFLWFCIPTALNKFVKILASTKSLQNPQTRV